jgi:hypothetical protein
MLCRREGTVDVICESDENDEVAEFTGDLKATVL